MKRLVITILLLSCVLNLTACSNAGYSPDGTSVYNWDNGVISAGNKKLTYFTEIAGSEATWSNGNSNFRVWIEEADDLGFISCNSQGIIQDDMDKHGSNYFYTEYLGTQLTYITTKTGNFRFIAQGYVNDNIEVLKKQLNDDMTNALLNWGNVKVVMNDVLTFGNDYDVVKIRPNACLIPGIAKVSVGTKAECVNPYTHTQGKKTYELMYYTNGSYDYYTYEGLLIQLTSGMALGDYVTFK